MRTARGFTLIEVMVALAIVAVALGAGIKAAGALTTNTQRMSDVTAAQWCADNKLADLRLTGLTPPVGDTEFTCVQLGKNYDGVLTVEPPTNPNFVNVNARIGDESGSPILNIRTVMRK